MNNAARLWRNTILGKARTIVLNKFKRRVIVHYHLFKNAGSSIDHMLAANFGSRWCQLEGDSPSSVLAPSRLANHIRTNSRILAISSHTARFPLPEIPGTKIFPIIFLRNPMDRIRSIYDFERRRGGKEFSGRCARTYGLAGYLERMLDDADNNGIVLRNFQTLCLSDAADGQTDLRQVRVTDAHLCQAKQRLAGLAAFGMVEHFDDSLLMLGDWLQPAFPGMKLFSVHANKSGDGSAALAERISRIENSLGTELTRRLRDANSSDMALYEYAVECFSRLSRRALRQSLPEPSSSNLL